MGTQVPYAVSVGGTKFRIDTDADVPYRRTYRSVMVPRADISGVPGAINLQRDVWLWSMSDFYGGEGRIVFDSSDPIGPPTYYRSTGGIDTRIRGQFSLHPTSQLIYNETGAGGSGPTNTTWTNTDLSQQTGSPTFSSGPNSNLIKLSVGDVAQSPARSALSTGDTVLVQARFVRAHTIRSNKKVDIKLTIRNTTDGTDTATETASLRDGEDVTLSISFTPTTGKTYRYYVQNNDGGSGVWVFVKSVKEAIYGGGTASAQDIREARLGIGGNVWAQAWDGTNTDILKWDFTNDDWDQATANMVASAPRGLTGSDQYMYSLHASGVVYRIASDGTAVLYANAPDTSGEGEPLSLAVANNRLYALYDQALVELALDSTTSIPLDETDDPTQYKMCATPGQFPKEASPDTTLRRHMSAIPNGVRFFVNMAGEQTVIYEWTGHAGDDGALTPIHSLPLGYTATAIKHYSGITFIATKYVNSASDPAVTKAALYYITSDNLLRHLGELRPWDSNSQPVQDITAYGHDVYFLQGRRIWRYDLGRAGLTLENEVGATDESAARALVVMDKKYWAAVEGEGTFVADDGYSTDTTWLESPKWDFDLPDSDKVLLSLDVLMKALPSNCRVELEYKKDDSDDWTTPSSNTITTANTTKSSIAISTSSSTVKFRDLQWRIGLTSLDGVDTPVILAVTARVYVLEYERFFDFTILAEDDTSTDRLIGEQTSGAKKIDALFDIVDNKNLTTFATQWESSERNPTSTSYQVVLESPLGDITSRGNGSIRLQAKVIS